MQEAEPGNAVQHIVAEEVTNTHEHLNADIPKTNIRAEVEELIEEALPINVVTPIMNTLAEVVKNFVQINNVLPKMNAFAMERERGKRVAQLSEHVRSPYVQRMVDLSIPVTKEEAQVTKYILQNTGEVK